MSFFGNVNKYNKATTVVRFFNASYSHYIDLLRNYCYCTSQVPIPPTLLTCLPHPWNIPQSTRLRNISSTKKTCETKHTCISKHVGKLSTSSNKNVTILSTSNSCSFKICRFNSSRFSRRSSIDFTNSLVARGSWGFMGGRLCTCGPVFWNLNK